MSEEGGSNSQESCDRLKDTTHNISESSSDSSQLDAITSQRKPCVCPAAESTVERPVYQGTDTTVEQTLEYGRTSPTLEQTLEYRRTSPTLDMAELFNENADVVSEVNSPSAPANISDMSSLEENSDLNEIPTELHKGIAKDQLKRLKTGDVDLSHFQCHVDLSETTDSIEKPDQSEHVRMPYYTFGLQGVQTRWDIVKTSLAQCATLKSSSDLAKIVHAYNRSSGKMDVSGFENYLTKFDNKERTETVETLEKMAQLAVEVERLCPKSIPILQQQKDQAITLSQHQIACLLANAFFSTFPGRTDGQQKTVLPSINFSQ
jgi:hypothetical protein